MQLPAQSMVHLWKDSLVMWMLCQVGALREIKRDMALRRNSLHKQLVHELEEWVFVSVIRPKGASGRATDADAEDEDSGDALPPLIRSASHFLLHALRWQWLSVNPAVFGASVEIHSLLFSNQVVEHKGYNVGP